MRSPSKQQGDEAEWIGLTNDAIIGHRNEGVAENDHVIGRCQGYRHARESTCTKQATSVETDVLDRFGGDLQRDKWMRSILPIGVLFSGSLILSNYAYLT